MSKKALGIEVKKIVIRMIISFLLGITVGLILK
jgi:hypothetical protein